MRFLCLGLSLVLFSTPSLAQVAVEQLTQAMQIFRPIPDLADPLQTHQKMTELLEGRWIVGPDSLLSGNSKPTEEFMKRACERSGAELTVSRYQFKLSKTYKRKDGSMAVKETVYSDQGGNIYNFKTDPEQYLDYLGILDAQEAKYITLKYHSLRGIAGRARVLRPSPDVLVFLPDGEKVQFAMRCN